MELMRPCVNVNAIGHSLASARVVLRGESVTSSSKNSMKNKNGSCNRRLFQSRAYSPLSSSFPPPSSSNGDTKREICVKASASGSTSKEEDVVFVAGSTGKVGSRLVRELLKLGFRVRAGVRSTQRAGTLLQSVRQLKPIDSAQAPPEERLEIVECDLENQSIIGRAIGNASVVICCIGASEKEIFDITGPYRIDYKATVNLIQAAKVAKAKHFILLTSLGTNKIGFPAALLNLFWGVLLWKRKAEEELISSGLPYTIVRPGGMERPTDSFKETHNLVLANEDTYFGGLVSNLQVAELMACMAKNRRLSYCKVVEVIAETTAPLRPMEDLLSTIPPQRSLPPEPKVEPVAPPPIITEQEEEVPVESKPRPQSPYAAYEDLKPPSSPSPTKPDVKAKTEEPKPTASIDAQESPNTSDGGDQFLSPYAAYDDLKPPSSPSPNAPNNGAPESISLTADQNSGPSSSEKEQDEAQQKPYSLSPFTMYEDLKPPTSPIPSVPK